MRREGAMGGARAAPRPRAASLRAWGLWAALAGVLGFLIVYPLWMLLQSSLQTQRYAAVVHWTLQNYRDVVALPAVWQALLNTLVTSVGAVLITLLFGVPLAFLVARTDLPGKGTLHTLNLVPFFLSSVVGAVSWQTLAAPRTGLLNGIATRVLGVSSPVFNIYGLGGIIFVIGLFYTPYMYLMMLGAFRTMDASLEEAARVCGSTLGSAMRRITLPLVLPSVLSGVILVLVTSAGLYGVPLLLGAPAHVSTLATHIFTVTQDYPPRYGLAAAMSAALVVLTAGLLAVERRMLGRRAFVTVTGKGYRPADVRLGRWAWAALGFDVCYLGIAVVLPLVSLLVVSLHGLWTGWPDLGRLSLGNYAYLLVTEATARRGIINSLVLSAVGATVALALAAMLAVVDRRSRLPARGLLALVALLPATVPGIVMGVGFLMAWAGTVLYGTLWIIMLAYIAHYLPFGVRSLSSVLLSLSPDLDDSSRVAGAGWLTTARRITLPLLRPSLVTIWLLLFVIFMREVSASIVLYVPGTETLSVALIRIMQYAPYGTAAAFGVMQTVMLVIVIALYHRAAGHAGVRL